MLLVFHCPWISVLFIVCSTILWQPNTAWTPPYPILCKGWTHGERQFLPWNIYNLNRCGRWEGDNREFCYKWTSDLVRGETHSAVGKNFAHSRWLLSLLSQVMLLSPALFHACKSNHLSLIFWTEEKCTKKKKIAIPHKNSSPFLYHELWLFLLQ